MNSTKCVTLAKNELYHGATLPALVDFHLEVHSLDLEFKKRINGKGLQNVDKKSKHKKTKIANKQKPSIESGLSRLRTNIGDSVR
jgi:hypothetical protein